MSKRSDRKDAVAYAEYLTMLPTAWRRALTHADGVRAYCRLCGRVVTCTIPLLGTATLALELHVADAHRRIYRRRFLA